MKNSHVLRQLLVACAVGLGVAACTSPRPGVTPGDSTTAESRSAMEALQSRLQRDFAGTPVQIELLTPAAAADAGLLRVAVPQPHGFEPGRSAVRPALGAVLDRLVPALREHPRWMLATSGPVDAKGGAWLGSDRGAAVRDYLVARGVAVSRFAVPQRHEAAVTEVRISARAPAR